MPARLGVEEKSGITANDKAYRHVVRLESLGPIEHAFEATTEVAEIIDDYLGL